VQEKEKGKVLLIENPISHRKGLLGGSSSSEAGARRPGKELQEQGGEEGKHGAPPGTCPAMEAADGPQSELEWQERTKKVEAGDSGGRYCEIWHEAGNGKVRPRVGAEL
jgi:hypothetical protein